MVINFKEIQDSHAFENFCMHLLQTMGLTIPIAPAIGPDGGRDIICEEPSQFEHMRGYRWLVSCKHFASGERSVGINDDAAKSHKLVEHGCNGFMFFFSTPFTESFRTATDSTCRFINSQYRIFNNFELERILLSSPKYYPLIRQYFPESHTRLVGLKNEECCQFTSSEGALYAVYIRNIEDNSISYNVSCEGCIGNYVEYLEGNNVDFGVAQIRSSSYW